MTKEQVAYEVDSAAQRQDNLEDEHFYNVPLEEFLYQAELQRKRESDPSYGSGSKSATIPVVGAIAHFIQSRKNKKNRATSDSTQYGNSPDSIVVDTDKKNVNQTPEDGFAVEAENASRVMRNASWVSVFYLITTDILGPTSAPYAVSQLGFVPGALLYFLLGIAAAYTGYILWRVFLKTDSLVYPLKNYGDMVGRLYGKKIRYAVDFLQIIQLLCNVAVIILGNGQGLYQIAQRKACFTVLVVVWSFAGMIIGQIRTLQKFGFLSSLAIYINLFVCFASMGVIAHSAPNYTSALAQNGVEKGPIITKAIIQGTGGRFSQQLQAAMNIVYAYGGAMMFVEFMAEMRRPWDFWKGMVCAQSIIFSVYMLYGLFVYAQQGQFVVNPAQQSVSVYGWQTAFNILHLVSALIAAGLYGNVGIKVAYNTVFRKLFKAPDLNTKAGKIAWIPIVIFYWALCYVIASAIPQFSTLTGLVGAVCILQFTYTFPPLIALGLDVQKAAMEADGPYDPINKIPNRIDSWKQASRWIRGFKKRWYLNIFHIIFFLAALTTAILGIYASALELKEAYAPGSSTAGAFSCSGNI